MKTSFTKIIGYVRRKAERCGKVLGNGGKE